MSRKGAVLRPNGDDDCVGEVARVYEEDGDAAAGGHFGGGDGPRGGDVLQPDAEAACDLDGGKVGVRVKRSEDSFFNHVFINPLCPPILGELRNWGAPQSPGRKFHAPR